MCANNGRLIVSLTTRPRYRKRKTSSTSEPSVGRNQSLHERFGSIFPEASGVLVPTLTASRSVREAIKEVKMVQVCMVSIVSNFSYKNHVACVSNFACFMLNMPLLELQ